MADGAAGLLLFLLSYGPTILLWAAILSFPARFAWKKLRRSPTANFFMSRQKSVEHAEQH